MIERLIFSALKEGTTEILGDLDRLRVYFHHRHCLDDAEIDKILQAFEEKTPSVIHNYPRADSKFPLWSVVLGNENEDTKFLDDFAGVLGVEEAEMMGQLGLAGADVRSSIYQHQFFVLTYTENPDLTIWYYQIAKYLLTRQRDYFKKQGLLDTVFAGQDMSPSQEYVPEWLFARRLVMTCKTELPIIDDTPARIREVRGIHVQGGSESDIGDVVANVTVVDELSGES